MNKWLPIPKEKPDLSNAKILLMAKRSCSWPDDVEIYLVEDGEIINMKVLGVNTGEQWTWGDAVIGNRYYCILEMPE